MLILAATVHLAVATLAIAQSGRGDNLAVGVGALPAMAVAGHGVALQAQRRLDQIKQLAVGGAVRVVTGGAVLDGGSVFKHVGTAHCLMALGALRGLALQAGQLAAVGIMATGARHGPFLDRVVRAHAVARQHILMAGRAQCGSLAALFHRDIQRLDLGRVRAVAVAALQAGLVVLGEGEIHVLAIPEVAALAVFRLGQPGVQHLRRLCPGVFFRCHVARRADTVIYMHLGFCRVTLHALRPGHFAARFGGEGST